MTFKFAGVSLAEPVLMGVLNVTPDSFSDGGRFAGHTAVTRGVALAEAGASVVDVGGESTRPGAEPVSVAEEIARVVPVVRSLADRGICVSIDTRHVPVMAAALDAGARIVNDVTALQAPGAVDLVARTGASAILMHMRGEPRTMQDSPTYGWAPRDVFDFLEGRVAACMAAGVTLNRLAVDPGIGFGKDDTHNAQILKHLYLYGNIGCALVVGASRKSFIGRMSRGEGPHERLPGSIAAALYAVANGAHVLRVHDVAETRQALAVWSRIRGA